MLLKWVINLDNRNLEYSAFQLPENKIPRIPSTLSFGGNVQGKLLRTKLYGGSGTTSSAKTRQFYQIVVVRLHLPLITLEYSSSFPLVFADNISQSFMPALPTQFSGHIVCSVFDRSFNIAVVFLNQSFDFFSSVSRINYLHTYWIKSLTKHIFQNVLTVFK